MNGKIGIGHSLTWAAAILTIGLWTGGCSPTSKENKPSPSPTPSPSAVPTSTPEPASTPTPKPAATPAPSGTDNIQAPPANGAKGTVKITARYLGTTRPNRVVLNMAADPKCAEGNNGKKVGNVNLLVNKDMTVRNVICFVKDFATDKDFTPPADKALLNQRGCMYDPHVQTVMIDQAITVRNSDSTLHNIHTFAEKQRSENFAQPMKGDERDIVFKRAEIVKIKCDVHPWMSAFIGVFDHPYHAATGDDGSCIIELPAGDYEIGGWHEDLGDLDPVTVTIKAGEVSEIDLEVPG